MENMRLVTRENKGSDFCFKNLSDHGNITAEEGWDIVDTALEGSFISGVGNLLTQNFEHMMKGNTDDLFKKISLRTGMLTDGAIAAGTSIWQNADLFETGQVSAADATADVIVDTGVGISSGIAGMAAGAAIGSVVPVAGTAVGAAIGFATGVVAGSATSSIIEGSGLGDWAREGIGNALESNFEKPLADAWNHISDGQNMIQEFFGGGSNSIEDDSFWSGPYFEDGDGSRINDDSGDDQIIGHINGGSGDDRIIVNGPVSGPIVIDGGSGDDIIYVG